MNNKSFLTVDSGGSKTRAELYDGRGVLVKTATCKGYGIAYDDGTPVLELVNFLRDFAEGHDVAVALCNLGGRNGEQMEATLKRAFPKARVSVFRESLGVVGVELCLLYGAEVALMAGTGAIAVAPVGENVVISGGWGANISDRGSGYELGLNAVRLALDELDGTAPLSSLTCALTGRSEPLRVATAEEYANARNEIREKMGPFDRAHVASLARVVCDCALKGDKVALELYKTAGEALARTVLDAIKKTGRELSCVVVTGGMVNARDLWKDSFEAALKEEYGVQEVYYVADGISDATREIAKRIINQSR